ncbi:MAG: hypothetical protein GX066_01470 [Clostridiaceae bacterium]|nr:hypothetical protein [Clostridiaceae bacterium]
MAKLINGRIYFECEIGSFDSYSREFDEAMKLFPNVPVTIWDQSKQEEKLTDDELFDVYVLMNKVDGAGVKIFDRSIWADLVKDNLNRTKFAQIGCWKSEIDLVDEIKSACKILDIEEYGEQIEFYVELDESVREYITKRYLNDKGHIKWFNLILYPSGDKNSPIFVSEHFGEENYIFKLSAEEVEKVIDTVKNNHVYIRINRHQ